ncbi:PepSY domain-containing protein [Fulvivirga sp. 29W222]|uniref:PepSY domain-containing protein n=1 Tax=Fulvivirga marina TaxID=2494733 RepID=A0A937G370_9BACT|nr:PepSY domain-containing protein [Fulvivirga marina]MBL6447596.1 PepSY domain-containing protein [Fulvivirga marina]
MNKNLPLHQWLWKWHFVAGIVSLPIVILLSATGVMYLFKDQYEKPLYEKLQQIPAQEQHISYQQQWAIARKKAQKSPNFIILPESATQATEFVSGRFSDKSSLFVNPVDGTVKGELIVKDTDMYIVRKLHGELLTGKYGTKVVELVASWMVVLILTGLYIWWPMNGWKLKGFFTIRTRGSRRIMYRDIHAVSGFWFSLLLLLVLAGGLPWTDVFGSNFKWVQEQTHTGYPKTWDGRALSSKISGTPLTLDDMVNTARRLDLKGEVSIHLPQSAGSVFSISNRTSELSAMRVAHFDQYSGKQLLAHTWSDIGPFMQARLWVMAFHQGEFGLWNWYLMLFVGFMLLVMSISAIYSYLLRKQKGQWNTPKVPAHFRVGSGIIVLVVLLGVVLPLFGTSVILIACYEWYSKSKRNKKKRLENMPIENVTTY